jgi:DNA-binding MarR family transcriptional regulator
MSTVLPKPEPSTHSITLLTNHAHVLVLIADKPDIRMREIAMIIGITERAVQRIVDDLTVTGYVLVTKDGRRNRYEIQPEARLRHPLAHHRSVGDLIRFVHPRFQHLPETVPS